MNARPKMMWVCMKLGRLGFQNQIVDDLDSKPFKFGCLLYDDSDFKVKIVSSITILILLQSLFD